MRHLVRASGRAILLLTLFAVTACAPRPAPVSPTPRAAATSTALPVSPTAAPTVAATAAATTATTRPAPTAAATTAPTPAAISLPEPLFGPAWGERDIYRANLVASEQPILHELPGASEYRIQLEIAPTMTAIGGQQQVRYTNREEEALNEVYMRLFPNALGGKMTAYDVTVNGAPVTAEVKFERTALRVPLAPPLQPGESVVIGLRYDIEVPEALEAGYGLISFTDGILAVDTPYLPIPVYDDEGWNAETPPANADTSYNDASFYLAQVTAPASVTVVATGIEVEAATTESNRGESRAATYALGPARDFFVAASDKYTVTTRQVGDTRVNSYALPGEERARDAALTHASEALRIYSERFGPYPYAEFDVATTPMLALGIEYPGTVGISRRVYSSEQADLAPLLQSTVAHEAAHQWFYNVVGSDQVDEPWLDEALTQYSTWLYYLDRHGESAAEAWRENWGARWDRTDRTEKPVGLPAAEYTQREYSSIVYGRGPLFLTALAEHMGQEKFDALLADYARNFRWGIATADDFKRMAEEACACQLDDLYEQWLEP